MDEKKTTGLSAELPFLPVKRHGERFGPQLKDFISTLTNTGKACPFR
jgi:hypothetical protein